MSRRKSKHMLFMNGRQQRRVGNSSDRKEFHTSDFSFANLDELAAANIRRLKRQGQKVQFEHEGNIKKNTEVNI